MTTPKPSLTHDDLCVKAEKWLYNKNCGVVFSDRFRVPTFSGEEPDAIGFRLNVSILIECKATRADFLSDKRKRFRKDPTLGVGDWRFYLSPPGIIHIEDLPEGWGLLWANGKKIECVHGIPTNVQWESCKPFTGDKDNELRLMYTALRRVRKHGMLDLIYQK